MLTYEEGLMHSDGLFIDLIKSASSNLLVVEDADTLLMPRSKEGNPVMNKLLNVSDGIMKDQGKKIIFTANITYNNINKIDPALLRPGRAYDVQDFRHLTYQEACKVARLLGIAAPAAKLKGVTLAQLTNTERELPTHMNIGFHSTKAA